MGDWLREVVDDAARKSLEPIVQHDRAPTCLPHRLLVRGKTHDAKCTKCGLEFTAFDALMLVTRDWALLADRAKAMSQELYELEKKREILRRQVKRLKAMGKRCTDRDIASASAELDAIAVWAQSCIPMVEAGEKFGKAVIVREFKELVQKCWEAKVLADTLAMHGYPFA